MKTPKPGRPVRGSTTGRPIMALLDLLGRRTTLRALWELRAGPLSFRALVTAAATNPGVLNARLGELRDAGIVELTTDGYALTPGGRALFKTLRPLASWAEAWAGRLGAARRSG
jgi:DNA-binding HxlR family transcriptional regulator